jgi:hypothetical protein
VSRRVKASAAAHGQLVRARPRSRTLGTLPTGRPGWPKPRVCLLCGHPRQASGPGDRLHPACRIVVAERAAALTGGELLPW